MADLDKIIHERARLKILTYLVSSQNDPVSFNELQKKLDFTSGNLSVQLKKLKDVGYVEILKTFKENKPYTTIEVTPVGFDALKEYVSEMETILSGLKF